MPGSSPPKRPPRRRRDGPLDSATERREVWSAPHERPHGVLPPRTQGALHDLPASSPTRPALFRRSTWTETSFVADALRTETIGGALLLMAAVAALIFANSPWRDAYAALRDTVVGVEWGHLQLTLGHWAADGLLAIFFFVAGLELKREFLVGDLRTPAKAAVPVAAAVGGVVVPALVFLAVVTSLGGEGDAMRGWAIPTATDIAFALAVLAVIGCHLPSAMRSFLLTLAVVDDLIAITIIAVFYTSDLEVVPLLLALVPLGLFAALTQRRITYWWLLLPAGVRDVGARARVRRPRHGRRGAPRARRAGQGPGVGARR